MVQLSTRLVSRAAVPVEVAVANFETVSGRESTKQEGKLLRPSVSATWAGNAALGNAQDHPDMNLPTGERCREGRDDITQTPERPQKQAVGASQPDSENIKTK